MSVWRAKREQNDIASWALVMDSGVKETEAAPQRRSDNMHRP